MGRAVRYYPHQPALTLSDDSRVTFVQLHERVTNLAGALTRAGFVSGDRLALLLPNSPDYIELVYACAWLGIIAVPINTRLSPVEIDHVLADCSPRGLIRHSTLPSPESRVPLEFVLDEGHLDELTGFCPDPCYDPQAILVLVYTSGTTGRPKGVMLTHSNLFANVNNFNYWMRYKEGGAYLHAAPIFHIADFPAVFAAPAFGACQAAMPRFNASSFCEAVAKGRITFTVLVPTMINLLMQFAENNPCDLSSLEVLAYGGSPMAPELIRRTRRMLPNVKLVQGYGLSETGFLTGLQDQEHTDDRLMSCGRPCPGIDVQVADESGSQVEAGQHGELVARGANVMRGYWKDQKDTEAA